MPLAHSPIFFKITSVKIFSVLVANTLIALFVSSIHRAAMLIVAVIVGETIGVALGTAATLFPKSLSILSGENLNR